MKRLVALLLVLMLAEVAAAHISSSGFLVIEVQGQSLSGSLEIAVRDAELAIGADANHDGKISWGELHATEPRLARYVGTTPRPARARVGLSPDIPTPPGKSARRR